MKKLSVIALVILLGTAVYAEQASPDAAPSPGNTRSGGFIDAWVRLAGFFAFGGPSGGLFQKDERVFRAYLPDLFRAYVVPRDYRLSNNYLGGGGELDIMPPAVKFAPKRAFDFIGIKFGIRNRYGFGFFDSVITDEGGYFIRVEGYELFRAGSMSYHYWGTGPVIDLVFGPRSNNFNFIINCYTIIGPIFEGAYRGAASLRSARWLTVELAGLYGPPGPLMRNIHLFAARYLNRSKFSGYTVRCGLGPHLSINGMFPFDVGVNFVYAYSRIVLNTPLLIYCDTDRKAAHHEIGAEVSAGVHFL